MTSHRQTIWIAVAVLVVLAIIGGYTLTHMSYTAPIKDISTTTATSTTLGEATSTPMRFEIADTSAKQTLGLGNRASIPDNYGMLFVFQKADRYGFWMKDMLAPIDITWLSDTATVILIDHSVSPDTYPHVFYPPTPVKYVIETRAGYANTHGWTVGTVVPLPSPYGR